MHKKVLAIDLDPQGSMGFSLGLDIENCSTIYDVLKGQVSIKDAFGEEDAEYVQIGIHTLTDRINSVF